MIFSHFYPHRNTQFHPHVLKFEKSQEIGEFSRSNDSKKNMCTTVSIFGTWYRNANSYLPIPLETIYHSKKSKLIFFIFTKHFCNVLSQILRKILTFKENANYFLCQIIQKGHSLGKMAMVARLVRMSIFGSPGGNLFPLCWICWWVGVWLWVVSTSSRWSGERWTTKCSGFQGQTTRWLMVLCSHFLRSNRKYTCLKENIVGQIEWFINISFCELNLIIAAITL